VKHVLLPERADFVRQHAVVLCGDISPQRKLLSDSVSRAAGLTPIRCSEDREQVFSLCRRLNASLFLVAGQAFIEQLPRADMAELTNYGKGSHTLAVLESDALETSAGKMLRLGCRGVLPPQFSSKLLRRAVLAILKGEIWAPKVVLSELLSELLTVASLKVENDLTPQEARILELTMQGYKNSAIAEALFISLETVRWHKRRLNRKLRGPSRYPQAKAIPPPREIAVG
jgi:DNA-binding NarL/FixJ family response regulator